MSEPTALIEIGDESETYPDFRYAVIRCSEQDHIIFTSYRESYGEPQDYANRALRDHLDQHKPGRALDIEVSWEPVALCSVCEDGFGDIAHGYDGDLRCKKCETTWDIDGTSGERAEGNET